MQRFGLLLKSEIERNRKDILVFIGIILGIYLISPLFNAGRLSTHAFSSYIAIMTFVLPFVFYRNLFHNTKGVAFGMLPASQSEKFLVMFVLCALVVPSGMILFSWIISLIGFALTGEAHMMFDFLGLFTNGNSPEHFNLGFFDSFFWSVIGAQSFSLWGTCFFKNNKFWKTILSGFCFVIAISIIGSIYGIRLHFNHEGLIAVNDRVVERLTVLATVFVQICLPVLLWTWGFFRIRRQQF